MSKRPFWQYFRYPIKYAGCMTTKQVTTGMLRVQEAVFWPRYAV